MRELACNLDGVTLSLAALHCENFLERSRGLLFRPNLPGDRTLVLEPCNAIHTIGMRFAIDAVFVDVNGIVLKVVSGLRPWRFAAAWSARSTWEFAAGRALELGIATGSRLTIGSGG